MKLAQLLRSGLPWNGWVIISGIGAVAALLPSLYILAGLFRKPNDNWAHIREYMLADYALESLAAVTGTLAVAVPAGVLLAWLNAAYDYPGRRFFSFVFVLPLAVPPYIAAYTYASMLSYTGVVQRFARNTLGWSVPPQYLDIMSLKGAVFIYAMFLFPYIYLIAKSFFERHSAVLIDNARLLGQGPVSIFVKVALPLSGGAVAGGAGLVAFEVLNDYGVAKYFGLQTFTTAIFKTWFGMYDVDSAIRLAALLMCAVVGITAAEKLLRRRKRYNASAGRSRPLARRRLRGAQAALAALLGSAVFMLSFGIPVAQLTVWAFWTFDDVWSAGLVKLIRNTLAVSAAAAVMLTIAAVAAVNAGRIWRSVPTYAMNRLLSMGYSIPGAVLAIGVISVFLSLDRALAPWYAQWGWGTNKLVLSMSLAMLLFAYVVRFLSVGISAVEAGYDKIGSRFAEASRMLGRGATATFWKVELPLVKGAVMTGCLLAFMEIVKELPLTLLLRPFNFETLAAKAYQYAGDEQIYMAAVPSLLIIALGVLSVCLYQWLGGKETK